MNGPAPVRRTVQLQAMGRAITDWGTTDPAGGRSSSRRPELPWRSTRDPWAVLVSEVMLQQTQVSRVVPAYQAFLGRFPTPTACAAASLGDVLRAWKGLGYNRRARSLHHAARVMVEDHHGKVPAGLADLLALPGVGAYTARAVSAFSFEIDVGVVDTNAGRILSRAVAGAALAPREAQSLVDAMVPTGRGWEFNQALLDLGAAVCVSTDPVCTSCPLRKRCRWRAAGCPAPDPARGSAGVSTPQSRFTDSDRQGRGRLIDALRLGPVEVGDVPAIMGWPDQPERAERVASGLVEEGMVVRPDSGRLRLP
ncbi:MAG TPA: A/G-specific adenine glycosylase [Acidimicrobiales bacterium]|nr:A/G-specific adenine glycosylase [Acidimicrobiales bacterium]